MLPKKNRIPRKDFKIFFEKRSASTRDAKSTRLDSSKRARGGYFNSPNFSMRVAPDNNSSRFAVSVSKKVSKKAVDRNRLRRRSYAVIGGIKETVKGMHMIIAKPSARNLKGEELSKELISLIRSNKG